ncbi:DUF7678 domain-containing protein [Dyadobacter luticola]|nr:hypothetical protein [Dyadobacter luticola]
MFRKTFTLTDFQLRRLQELSELDMMDMEEHIRKAVDAYIKAQNFELRVPAQKDIVAKIKKRQDDATISRAFWVNGNVDKFEFSALILNAPAKSGMDKGRISKLAIWDPAVKKKTDNLIASCIMNYDRGWDIRPGKLAQPYYDKVRDLLDELIAQPKL